MKKYRFLFSLALCTFLFGMSAVFFYYLKNICFVAPDIADSEVAQILPIPDKSKMDWETLLSFEGKDLSQLTDEQSERLNPALKKLTDDSENFEDLRLISKISNANKQKFYAVIGIKPLLIIPGNCGLQIHLFDSEGKHIKYFSFDAGWRMDLKKVNVRYSHEIDREIIEIESEPVINGRNVAKQYYALINDQILPIRLEDDENKAVLNYFESPNHTIGLKIAGRSSEDWKKSLKSEDNAELLATLVWINGKHINPQKVPDYAPEDLNEAIVFEKVKNDGETKKIIQNLTKSKNKWLRENANLKEINDL